MPSYLLSSLLRSLLLLTSVCFFKAGLCYAGMEPRTDSSARDKFLKPIDAELAQISMTNTSLSKTLIQKQAEMAVLHKSAEDIFWKRESFLTANKDLFEKYQSFRATSEVFKSSAEGLAALQALIESAMQNTMEADLNSFLDSYLRSQREGRLIAENQLTQMITREIDQARKTNLEALAASLKLYGPLMDESPEVHSPDENSPEVGIAAASFKLLRQSTTEQTASFAIIAQQIHSLLENRKREAAKFQKDMDEVRAASGGDFDKITEFDLNLSRIKHDITELEVYCSVVTAEKNKNDKRSAELITQRGKAPPVRTWSVYVAPPSLSEHPDH